jgi:anaerobic selenocysteine-containing dehydrogenase
VAEAKGGNIPPAFSAVNVEEAVKASGATREAFDNVVNHILQAVSPVAIPGAVAMAQNNGLASAEAILSLNALTGNFGKPGGVFISPLSPNEDAYHRSASAQELSDFIAQMNSGAIKTLFVHGTNPLFELPKSFGFAEALKNVPQVISFATFPDETAVQADYIFPDRHGLESWGYQRVSTGSAQSVLAGLQPVVTGVYQKDSNEILYDARATADVLIEAAKQAGKDLLYADEVEFIQSKLASLIGETDGSFVAPEINTFAAYFQQHGGWWKTSESLSAPSLSSAAPKSTAAQAQFAGEGEFFFLPFVSPTLGEAGANKPWLQEAPDPTTTVMWNTWVEMNPETARELGLENDDVVKIVSAAGEVEVPVYLYPAIRPDTIAIPFGQGHAAYGRYASGRGVNPADLISLTFNEAGDLAFAGVKVRLEKADRVQVLSRLESKMGVYGEGLGEGN